MYIFRVIKFKTVPVPSNRELGRKETSVASVWESTKGRVTQNRGAYHQVLVPAGPVERARVPFTLE